MDRTSLYRHFDAEGNLLYIGISKSHMTRLGQHQHGSHWFWDITRIEIEYFETREDAVTAEALAIAKEKPRHNTQHARGETVGWGCRLPASLIDRLKDHAERNGRTMTDEVILILETYLEQRKKDQ